VQAVFLHFGFGHYEVKEGEKRVPFQVCPLTSCMSGNVPMLEVIREHSLPQCPALIHW